MDDQGSDSFGPELTIGSAQLGCELGALSRCSTCGGERYERVSSYITPVERSESESKFDASVSAGLIARFPASNTTSGLRADRLLGHVTDVRVNGLISPGGPFAELSHDAFQ